MPKVLEAIICAAGEPCRQTGDHLTHQKPRKIGPRWPILTRFGTRNRNATNTRAPCARSSDILVSSSWMRRSSEAARVHCACELFGLGRAARRACATARPRAPDRDVDQYRRERSDGTAE